MTLQSSGAISLIDVLNELKVANGARALPINLGDTDVRTLAGRASGDTSPISLTNLYGKSSLPPLTVSASNDGPHYKATTGSGSAPTIHTTCTPSGGTGSYTTFAWTRLSGATNITCANTTWQNPNFNCSVANGDDFIATWQVTVTDSGGHTASASMTVEMGGFQI